MIFTLICHNLHYINHISLQLLVFFLGSGGPKGSTSAGDGGALQGGKACLTVGRTCAATPAHHRHSICLGSTQLEAHSASNLMHGAQTSCWALGEIHSTSLRPANTTPDNFIFLISSLLFLPLTFSCILFSAGAVAWILTPCTCWD